MALALARIRQRKKELLMERNARYLIVGLFVLALTASAIAFVLWYSHSSDNRDVRQYEIYFTGSVSGLDPGSSVRYLGVDVGRVRRLAIDPAQPGRVLTVVDVDSEAPINSATRATLTNQGLTGLLFINLKQANNVDERAPLQQGARYPIIESESSSFDVVLNSLPELVARATSVFSDENAKAIHDTLTNLRNTTAGLPQTAANLGKLIDELRVTIHDVDQAAISVRAMTEDARPEVQETLAQLRTVAGNLADASQKVEQFVANSETKFDHLSNQGLFELERLLRDARVSANEFRDLSRSLKQNPSQLLYEPRASGTEIPR
jgi:phospholipid/cholesterol/gamma-HCH transport system substrate-binding protein